MEPNDARRTLGYGSDRPGSDRPRKARTLGYGERPSEALGEMLAYGAPMPFPLATLKTNAAGGEGLPPAGLPVVTLKKPPAPLPVVPPPDPDYRADGSLSIDDEVSSIDAPTPLEPSAGEAVDPEVFDHLPQPNRRRGIVRALASLSIIACVTCFVYAAFEHQPARAAVAQWATLGQVK